MDENEESELKRKFKKVKDLDAWGNDAVDSDDADPFSESDNDDYNDDDSDEWVA
jgi:hypothetical protein